jgi:hypothetical protein
MSIFWVNLKKISKLIYFSNALAYNSLSDFTV